MTYHLLGTLLLFLIVFPVFCFFYAAQINLWGDEVLSFIYATNLDAVHLPTYHWLVKPILALIGDDFEVILRMIHVIPFVVGLFFGILTIKRTFKDPLLIGIVSAIVITLPNYIFYATNLRMYSLLFMTEMAFIDSISRILAAKKYSDKYLLLWLVLSGGALVCTDYAGVIYYVAGVAFLLLRAIMFRQLQPLLFVSLPAVPALFVALGSLGNIQAILHWDVKAAAGINWQGFLGLAKWLYLGFRPALDLIYPASLPVVLAIALPLLWLAMFFYCAFKLFSRSESRLENYDWIILLALLWLPFVPTGYSFTRLFLPSQFFMIAVMTWGFINSGRGIKLMGFLSLGLLFFINLSQVFNPTLRLYNLIPYKEIASDIVNFAQQEKITRVLLSDNSFNTLSIERYIQKNPQARALKVNRVGTDLVEKIPQLRTQPFLFASHMDESNQFVDIPGIFPDNSSMLTGYIALEQLPYNQLWKQRLLDRSSQPYAVQVYIINQLKKDKLSQEK